MKQLAIAIVTAMSAVLSFAGVPSAGENPDLEKGAVGWHVPKPNFSVRDGAGRNGSKGLVWEAVDTNAYCIASYGVPFRPGQNLRISIWMKNEGLSKGEPGFCVEFFGKKGYLSGVGSKLAPNQVKKPGAWVKYVAETGPMPPAALSCNVDVFVKKGVTGRCVYDDVEVETLGFNRDALFYSSAPDDRLFEGKVRFSASTYADLRGLKPEEVSAAFVYDGPKGRCRTVADTFRDGLAELTLDTSRLKVGKQRIRFEVKAKDGRELDVRRLTFERLAAPPQAKVWFDAHRRMIVDGKPTYPLLSYMGGFGKDPRALPALDRSPFRMVMSYDRDMTKEKLDVFQAHGIRVIASFCSAWYDNWNPPVDISVWGDEIAFVSRKVAEIRDHPTLLGWYLADEPTSALMPRVRERYKMVKALDPARPALVVLCHGRQARETQCCCDVVGLDCYPVPGKGTEATHPANLAAAAAATREAVGGMRGDKPFWFVPQAYPHEPERARFPSFREMRSMVWQSIACGADGVLFYSLGEMLSNKEKPGYCFEEAWNTTCRVAQEIRDREAMLLTTEPAPVLAEVPAGVVARAWRLDGKTLLVAVNTTHKPVVGALTMDGAKIALDLGPDETFFH